MDNQAERAVHLLGATDALIEAIGGSLETTERALYEHNIAALQALLSKEQFAIAWAAGRSMTLEEAVTCARAI
jgi:hypothetical protein